MGKKPFSAKAKREQLRQKRLAATSSTSSNTLANTSKQCISATTSSPGTSGPVTTHPSPTPQRQARGRAPRGGGGGGGHAQRFRLQLDADLRTGALPDVGNQSRTATDSLVHTAIHEQTTVETSVEDIRPYPDDRFCMPRRPSWRYDESVHVVDRREAALLSQWCERVTSGNAKDAPINHVPPPFFEHNVETWRQLWRVLERSDVVIMVVDIRYPALHFVPDVYHYVVNDLGKGFVLAMNKCDLVSTSVSNAWKRYFETKYPKLSIVMFSSFPDAKLAPSEHNSEMLSKRERRMARSKLSAWGADKLLSAVYSLDICEEKQHYLEEWRAQLNDDSDDDDDTYNERGRVETSTYTYGEEDEYLAQNADMPRNRRKQVRQKRKRTNLAPADDGKLLQDVNSDEKYPTRSATGAAGSSSLNADMAPGMVVDEGVDGDVDGDGDERKMITLGIVGHPNAGKSSLINGIFRRKVVSTSKTPGHTKHLQTIFLTKRVRLCDCPGLVFPGMAARELQIIAGMYPIAQVRNPISVVRYLAERVPLVKVLKLETEIKKLEDFLLEKDYVKDGWTAWKICESWAMKRGYRTAKAARLDVARAANHILRLALDGRIVLATVPKGFKWSDDEEQGAREDALGGDDGDEDEDEDENGSENVEGSYTAEGSEADDVSEEESSADEGSGESSESEGEAEQRGGGRGGATRASNAFALLGEEVE